MWHGFSLRRDMKTKIPNSCIPINASVILPLTILGFAKSVLADGITSPVQSTADPFGLPLAGLVMAGGSTPASANFISTVLPNAVAFVRQNLPEYNNNLASQAFMIDPSKMILQSQQNVTATFVGEGAGYHNSLGVTIIPPGSSQPQSLLDQVNSVNSSLVFPDASSTVSTYLGGSSGVRTVGNPLLPGDFVNLGSMSAGTKLDFFLIANGAYGGQQVFSATESLNPDSFKQHVAAFTLPGLNSPYIFLSFEDMWGGGDKDFNDVIFAINIGVANVQALLATPEPKVWLSLGSFLAIAFLAKRQMNSRTADPRA